MTERKANRLIQEKSPYLQQHAYNPVDWYAWGEEAFERARREDKPILLSIGYSTCHWCHVMEHESFENDDIARLMNENFISIKVDREERPDVDQIYMTAVTAINGQGGWPLNIFLTPECEPFYGGTYFPPQSRWGHPGFSEVLTAVSHSWKNDRPRIQGASAELTALLRRNASKAAEGRAVDEVTLDAAFQELQSQYDPAYGGFGHAPKFPMGHNLSFLLRYWKRHSGARSLEMVRHTLTKMAQGGMYDQLGGGFHRYSTDANWFVPHFEKMLYDQALLARAYLEAYQACRDPFYKKVATEVLDYVLRDLKDPAGGFYSAEDADSLEPGGSHKKEGAFYVWTLAELKQELGTEQAEIFAFYYGAQENGNVQTDPHQEFTGKNILYTAHSMEETAQHFEKTAPEIQAVLADSSQVLLKARISRPRPHLDDKIMTDWNGLMISAFALAASVLQEDRYLKAAQEAADFLLARLVNKEGRLLHRFRHDEAGILGTLEDYAFLAAGLLDLYEAGLDFKYLKEVRRIADGMLDLFWDQNQGGFYLTGRDAEPLIVRPKEIYDGALPSGNSAAVGVLIRLYHLTGQAHYQKKAHEVVKTFAGNISQRPSAYAYCLSMMDFLSGPVTQVVLSGPSGAVEWPSMHKAVFEHFIPNKIILGVTDRNAGAAREDYPLLQGREPKADRVAAYVCQGETCRAPAFNSQELALSLKTLTTTTR